MTTTVLSVVVFLSRKHINVQTYFARYMRNHQGPGAHVFLYVNLQIGIFFEIVFTSQTFRGWDYCSSAIYDGRSVLSGQAKSGHCFETFVTKGAFFKLCHGKRTRSCQNNLVGFANAVI